MTSPDQAWWAKARQARDRLAATLLTHPDVSLIDIGLDPLKVSKTPVLRVHIRRGDGSNLNLPADVTGIPVRIVHGDYQPQRGS